MRLSDYQTRFSNIQLRREGGILEITIHKDGGPAKWGFQPGGLHEELGDLFYCVARDPDNRVVIFTGAGNVFLEELDFDPSDPTAGQVTPAFWGRIYKEGRDLIQNFLEIEAPVIAAVNGAAFIHSELAILADIVLAADHARFADKAHFVIDTVPGDGVHAAWSMVLGANRSRYFVLTGQEIDAHEALRLGAVAEVLPAADLSARAWELARELSAKSDLVLRHTRSVMVLDLKRRMAADLGQGLLLEGHAAVNAL